MRKPNNGRLAGGPRIDQLMRMQFCLHATGRRADGWSMLLRRRGPAREEAPRSAGRRSAWGGGSVGRRGRRRRGSADGRVAWGGGVVGRHGRRRRGSAGERAAWG
ncbi:hypothetical protein ABZP36_008777 [Zizania latifolia]